jgi:hypothetical protein
MRRPIGRPRWPGFCGATASLKDWREAWGCSPWAWPISSARAPRWCSGGLPDPADLGKVILVAAFGKAVIAAGPQAGRFIGGVARVCGGGRPNLAQAGGRDGAALDGALSRRARSWRMLWVEPAAIRYAAARERCGWAVTRAAGSGGSP